MDPNYTTKADKRNTLAPCWSQLGGSSHPAARLTLCSHTPCRNAVLNVFVFFFRAEKSENVNTRMHTQTRSATINFFLFQLSLLTVHVCCCCCHGDHGTSPRISSPAASTGGWFIPRGTQSTQLHPRRGCVSFPLYVCVCVGCPAVMNGSVVNVEIRGQGSECRCGAAFSLPGHTDILYTQRE